MSPEKKARRKASLSSRVSIANPLPGGSQTTTLFHAERYRARGDAYYNERGDLVFIDRSDSRLIAAELALIAQKVAYDRAAATGLASEREIRELPVAGDPALLLRKPGLPRLLWGWRVACTIQDHRTITT